MSNTRCRYSVMIPLEWNRGQLEKCLRMWTREQNYPAEQYELIAAGARSSLAEADLELVSNLLRPHDRLVVHEVPHDMFLCAAAAKEALGEILLFTESHFFPDSNLLATADQVFGRNEHWAGFSGSTERIVHNPLSAAEAEMYMSDIQYGLEEHPWRKILDQIFLVHREPYFDCGGLRAEFGHFGEWHLSAVMHQKGYVIGYAPEVKGQHFYSGSLSDLIGFTRDFVRGELSFYSNHEDDPVRSYFPEIWEWSCRDKWDTTPKREALSVALRALPSGSDIEILSRFPHYLQWLTKLGISATCGIWVELVKARWQCFLSHLQVHWKRLFGSGSKELATAFREFTAALIHEERLRFIQHWLSCHGSAGICAGSAACSRSFGLFDLEQWKQTDFRWSEPVAMFQHRLSPGVHRFEVRWLPIRTINHLAFFVNGKPLDVRRDECSATGELAVTSDEPVWFGWACDLWTAPGDERALGLPLASIEFGILKELVETGENRIITLAPNR